MEAGQRQWLCIKGSSHALLRKYWCVYYSIGRMGRLTFVQNVDRGLCWLPRVFLAVIEDSCKSSGLFVDVYSQTYRFGTTVSYKS